VGGGFGTGIVSLYFETYLLDSSGSGFVQHEYDRLISRILVCANEYPNIVLGLVELLKSWQNIFLRHLLLLEVDVQERIDAHDHEIGLTIRLSTCRRRKVNVDPFHVNHRQAHQHERGKQEKHDVDQGNDLDPGPLNWYRRTAVTADLHLGQ